MVLTQLTHGLEVPLFYQGWRVDGASKEFNSLMPDLGDTSKEDRYKSDIKRDRVTGLARSCDDFTLGTLLTRKDK